MSYLLIHQLQEADSFPMPRNHQTTTAVPSEHYRVTLVGNPNSGKTSLFNALTGNSYKVANYPGVTVERREGTVRSAENQVPILLTDLPGIYSLQGESPDERITRMELRHTPDLVVLVVDASNLQRNLFLASEILDLGIPAVIALNMTDLATQKGIKILDARLSAALDVPVIPLIASKKQGTEELRQIIHRLLSAPRHHHPLHPWATGDQELIDSSRKNPSAESASVQARIASARYRWIERLNHQVSIQKEPRSRWAAHIDAICTHRISGLLVFVAIMAFMFQSIYTWASIPMEFIDSTIIAFSRWVAPFLPEGQIRSLVVDGIIAGVGSVLIFIPQIGLLFFFIGILEDTGYLARAAFVIDRVMRKVGLQGRSFIPLLSSFACAIPGMMSTRSIPSMSDRMITLLVAPLMSCSARLPVYTLLIAAFIPAVLWGDLISLQGLVMTSLYLLGVMAAAGVAYLFRKTIFKGEVSIFLMEMPPFRLPSLRLITRDVIERISLFVRNAGSIILACSIILWFLASHPLDENRLPPPVRDSYAGMLGQLIEPVLKPLGFNWQISIGIISSFAAREVFVSSLATVYSLDSEEADPQTLTNLLASGKNEAEGLSTAGALSLLVFYVFSCQCMSTLAVCRRETGSWRWPVILFLYMTALAYGASWITFRTASAIIG